MATTAAGCGPALSNYHPRTLREFAQSVLQSGRGYSGSLTDHDEAALGDFGLCLRANARFTVEAGHSIRGSFQEKMGGAPLLGELEERDPVADFLASAGESEPAPITIVLHAWRPCSRSAIPPEERHTLDRIYVPLKLADVRLEMIGTPGSGQAQFRFSGGWLGGCADLGITTGATRHELRLAASSDAAGREAAVGVDVLDALEGASAIDVRLCGTSVPVGAPEHGAIKRFVKLFRMAANRQPAAGPPAASKAMAPAPVVRVSAPRRFATEDSLVRSAHDMFVLQVPAAHNLAKIPYEVLTDAARGALGHDRAFFEVRDFGQAVLVGVRELSSEALAALRGSQLDEGLRSFSDDLLDDFGALRKTIWRQPPRAVHREIVQTAHGSTLIADYLAPGGSLLARGEGRRPTAADVFDTKISIRLALRESTLLYVVAEDDDRQRPRELAAEFFARVELRRR